MANVVKTCSECSVKLAWNEKGREFLKKLEEEPQNICFECGQKLRLSFRNERTLYNRKCDFSGESIISIYSSDKPYKIYKSEHWFSDKWNPKDYGQFYDPNRSFFEQFADLVKKVPLPSLFNLNGENSDYCNYTYGNKNCYLIIGGDFNQDCLYGTLSMHNEDIVDCDYSNRNKLCYMMSDSINCYNCRFVFDSKNCTDCYFVSDCSNCTECILCTNLTNKTYCINNLQYSKEDYFKRKKELIKGGNMQQQENIQQFLELRKQRKVKYAHTISCDHCTGDYLKNSKDCENTFDASESENLDSVIFASKAKESFESGLLGDETELCYNSIAVLGSYFIKHSIFIINSSYIEYSLLCFNSKQLFGCVGLRNGKYCILNKQYSEEDYLKLCKRIIEDMKKRGEYGKFFPKNISQFGYNETAASQYYPFTKGEAIAQGFKWHDRDITNRYQGPVIQVADNIADVTYEITKQILVCENCEKNYRIINEELNFYRKMSIPIPRQCPDCRYKFRLSLRNPRKLWDRTCAKCQAAIKTSYAPERPEKVYCEECYLKEVY